MSIEFLKDKSEENFKTGEWAEKKSFYDTAISRYYYCVYQKIIYISKKKGFYEVPEKSKDSHIKTINIFISELDCKLSTEEKIIMLKMKNLRRLRNNAEYDEIKTKHNDFNLTFKYSFNNINNIINKFL